MIRVFPVVRGKQMRDIDELVRSLADRPRQEIIAALSREAAAAERRIRSLRTRNGEHGERRREAMSHVERIGRILFFLHHGMPATGATAADQKLYDLLSDRWRSR
jgi:hypothetical protein